ncbi:MAG: DUF3466 family protein [Phycisphaerales bacterium]
MSIRNNRRRMLVMAGLGAGVLAGTNVVCAQIPCSYDVQIIASSNGCGGFGTVNTVGLGLNEHGDVVGYYKCPLWNHSEAFLWTADGGFVTLQRPQGVSSAIAVDINDDGVICGTALLSGLGFRGFVYDNGEWTILDPVVPDGGWSSANAINNAGVVVGQRSITKNLNPQNAYIWSAEEGFSDLGVMKGGVSRATDLTERGDVVGSTGALIAEGQEAFLWQDGELTLLGHIPQGISSWAVAVSNQGSIAGGGLMDPDQRPNILGQPALRNNGKWLLLGLLPNCDVGGSGDMNDDEMIVGLCVEPDNTRRAFIWTDGTMFDLNDLVPRGLDISIERGWGISNSGQIVADGHDARNQSVTFLLTPVVAPLGDLDGDCIVGATDLLILLAEWGQRDSPADLNGDGIVGAADLLILLVNWG